MTNTTNPYRQRYHRMDGWRGWRIPARAVAGVSDTGTWSDSPAPSDAVMAEFKRLQAHLRANGIRSRVRHAITSNLFCVKHWLTIVDHEDFAKAAQLAANWLHEHRDDTRYIHDADLAEVGFKPQPPAIPEPAPLPGGSDYADTFADTEK